MCNIECLSVKLPFVRPRCVFVEIYFGFIAAHEGLLSTGQVSSQYWHPWMMLGQKSCWRRRAISGLAHNLRSQIVLLVTLHSDQVASMRCSRCLTMAPVTQTSNNCKRFLKALQHQHGRKGAAINW